MSKISVITVSMNAEATLEDCIRSVAIQEAEKEHILIDGLSSDGTVDLIDKYRGHFSKVISEPDKGIYDAMNKGLKAATGDIVGFLNADDFYAGFDILEKVSTALSDRQFDACYGDLKYVDPKDVTSTVRYWQSDSYNPKRFYHGWMPPHPTFYVRRAKIEELGLFNTNLGSAADYEFMLRYLLKNRLAAVHIPDVLVHMRSGGVSNVSLSNRLAANRNDREAWRVNRLKPYPWTLTAKPLRKLGQWVRKS